MNWEKYIGDADAWDRQVDALEGNFYQSYGWGEVRKVAGWSPLRLVAKQGESIVALVSVLLKHKLGVAVCWIPGGPSGAVVLAIESLAGAIKKAVQSQFLYCRIGMVREESAAGIQMMEQASWSRPEISLNSGMTMLYSLHGDEPDRYMRTSSNWRHNLKRSARYNSTIEHWVNPDATAIYNLYREMEALKGLPVQHSKDELLLTLTECIRNVIVYRCVDTEGKLVAIRAAGICGNSALDLLAAANEKARSIYATHATLWALLNHCSQLGIAEYDLSGVDPVRNKGVYDFKHGTGARLVTTLGEWEWASIPGLTKVVNWVMGRKM